MLTDHSKVIRGYLESHLIKMDGGTIGFRMTVLWSNGINGSRKIIKKRNNKNYFVF